MQQIQDVNNSLQEQINISTLQIRNMNSDIQRLNNTLGQQMQLYFTQLHQSLTTVNSSLQQQLEIQQQQIIIVNQSQYNINNTLSTTVSQVTNMQNKQTQTKNDVITVQNQVSGINDQINNINNINSVQNADIAVLKAKTQQGLNGALICQIIKKSIIFGSSYYEYINGYCTNLKMCCYNVNNSIVNCLNLDNTRQGEDQFIFQYTSQQCGTLELF
ncbi:Hypothetical_protein [Hexamita inflata]|uniref:Hypothetical_protein n=1 Tax=Hexamita inflata TaxID=28002 RepID=A0AA86U4V8_9EUKA|nr:Hypothetical protein HINF_LOCUS28574 [Hexamita inflata]